jgi:hypothetical protein
VSAFGGKATKRQIEVFSAGCAVCTEVIEMVRHAAGPSDEFTVHDMKDINVVRHAKSLGVSSVPSVVIDGKLADYCSGELLRAAGLGRAP